MWDLLLIPVYGSLLALLLVHARHGLRYSPQNLWAGRWDRLASQVPLLALMATNLLQDVGVLWGLGKAGPGLHPGLVWVEVFSCVKSLALLGFVVCVLVELVFRSVASTPGTDHGGAPAHHR